MKKLKTWCYCTASVKQLCTVGQFKFWIWSWSYQQNDKCFGQSKEEDIPVLNTVMGRKVYL